MIIEEIESKNIIDSHLSKDAVMLFVERYGIEGALLRVKK